MRPVRLGICFGFVAAALSSAAGQPPADKKDPQAAFEPKSGPGAGQKFLEQFVGEWAVAKAFFPRGGGEPSRSAGECKQTMIHAGRFLQSEFTFGGGPTKTTGLGLIGFEPATSKFTSVWTDSRQTKMSFRQGADKFDGKQIVLHGQALGDEKTTRRSKTVTRLEDDGNKIVHRQFSVADDGQERPVMELVMTRKPTTPAPK